MPERRHPAMHYFWDDWTEERKRDWFKYWTPDELLAAIARNSQEFGTPDKCTDPVTLARVARIINSRSEPADDSPTPDGAA